VSFFEELKQRRVIRVATVYLVVAWVAIQAASIALPAFDAPGWTLRVIILLFALGFPLALLLSWALDVTPEGLRFTAGKVGNKRMATISAALAALAVAWYFLGQPAFRPGAAAPERSIAVLPFVNMSGNAANDYFSDGLAETTLDMLAQVPDLKVIARTSSFAFKGKATDMREIGRQLGAAHVLEGSVQQAGDTVRITVQLIRAKDGSHLWSKQFDRRMTDVFHIQDEIATSVVDALALQLPESTQRRMVRKRTDNVAAYDAYLQGMALMPKRDVGDMRRALAHFERAIRIDPGYARAYVGAHDALHLIDNYGSISDAERRKEQAYLQRALQLAPDMGEVQVARGVALEMANQPEAAEAAYRRGVALAPGYATGWQWLGEVVSASLGRYEEAIPLLRKALALDPLSPVIRGTYAFSLGQAGHLDEALAQSNKLIADDPTVARAYDDRSVVYAMRGDLVSALRDLQQQDALAPDAFSFRTHRCFTMMDFGAVEAADACMRPLIARAPDAAAVLGAQARLAYLRGDLPSARAFLQRIPEEGGAVMDGSLAQRLGDVAPMLALSRKRRPHWFDTPPGTVSSTQAFSAMETGLALLRSGDRARGESLVRAAMAAVANRPYAAVNGGRNWIEVVGHEYLGERDAALQALKQGVDAGYFQLLADLEEDPFLDDLRKDPRYERVLAPARAKAAAQVEAARKAGLL